MRRVIVNFTVDPYDMIANAHVQNPVRVVIVKPESPLLSEFLGESGKKFAEAEFHFFFERSMAEYLAKEGVVKLDEE